MALELSNLCHECNQSIPNGDTYLAREVFGEYFKWHLHCYFKNSLASVSRVEENLMPEDDYGDDGSWIWEE